MRRSKCIQIRVTEDTLRALKSAADRAERNLSDWARRVLLREARKKK